MAVFVTVRSEEPGDVAQVRVVNQRAFGGDGEASIVDALRAASGAISLVATRDGAVVGHILFTPVTVDDGPRGRRGAGLAPVAVLPEHQRQGVGAALVRAGLDECRTRGFDFVVVLGHPEYYPKFGFEPAWTRGLTCEFPVRPEVFMVLELRGGALSGVNGLVRYDPEFSKG